MTQTGFCAFPSQGSHGYCHEELVASGRQCSCPCHTAEVAPSRAGFGSTLSNPTTAPALEPAEQ